MVQRNTYLNARFQPDSKILLSEAKEASQLKKVATKVAKQAQNVAKKAKEEDGNEEEVFEGVNNKDVVIKDGELIFDLK